MIADFLSICSNLLAICFGWIHSAVLYFFPQTPWAGYALIITIVFFLARDFLRKHVLHQLKPTFWYSVIFAMFYFAMHAGINLSTRL